ncbi:MAG: zinc metallopeptidase [Firmicutes bacterium]|nr:zinc metallopeptidase [Bacillota bacterium]
MFFDSGYILLVLPALVFALYAQSRVRGTFERYSRYRASSGKTGGEVARELLNGTRLDDVGLERVHSSMGDHYDPRARVLRLSPQVYDGASVAALGVAAHEVGHALQHDLGYAPLSARNAFLPVAQFGSSAAWPLFLLGFIAGIPTLMDLGILFFFAAVLFQVITLPVEYNASNRAMELLEAGGYVSVSEAPAVRQVLNAAALTYVAATAMAVAQLVRLLILRGSRRD